jgi:hypothetical protein
MIQPLTCVTIEMFGTEMGRGIAADRIRLSTDLKLEDQQCSMGMKANETHTHGHEEFNASLISTDSKEL